jgi:hypothetical protein
MLHLLVDTCVWLDLAKDYREQPVISALQDLIAAADQAGRSAGRLGRIQPQ